MVYTGADCDDSTAKVAIVALYKWTLPFYCATVSIFPQWCHSVSLKCVMCCVLRSWRWTNAMTFRRFRLIWATLRLMLVSWCWHLTSHWFSSSFSGYIFHTQRGRSRAQHIRGREADVEGAKKWRLVHLRRSKGEDRRAELTFGVCFRAKAPKDANGQGRAAEPIFGGVWSKTPNSSHRRLAIGCFQGNQYVTLSSTVRFPYIPFQQTVLPPSHALILCQISRKSLKMADFSRTGSRNMAETCAINFDPGFLFDFYSDRGSTATPSARSNVSWCGPGRNGVLKFSSFFSPNLITHGVS